MTLVEHVSAGMVIDGFQLEEKLHKGGMATLWRVSPTAGRNTGKWPADMPLIMKVPILGNNDDPTAIVGFEQEMMIFPKLKGIHVPRYIASGDFTTQPFIVMERVPGESLRAYLEELPLPLEKVVEIGISVAKGLHDLHKQNLIHLDLKPSNIMFRPTGEAVFIDFGLSRHDQLPDLLDEEFRLPMGTGPYIAPEQVQGVRHDPRSDIFALGVMLYYLLTNVRPFGNPQSVRGLKGRLTEHPALPKTLRAEIPDWLQEVVMRCMARNPEQRYQTAKQLALDLQHPQDIVIQDRSQAPAAPGMFAKLKQRFQSLDDAPQAQSSMAEHLSRAAFVMVAVDVSVKGGEAMARLRETLRETTARILTTYPNARLACVAVQKTSRIANDIVVDREGHNIHVKNLVALKHWARPLNIPAERITYHVLEAPDVAQAILEYAHGNQVDQIIVGARGHSALRRYLGSVSAQVVAEAECTVTVVKHRALELSADGLSEANVDTATSARP